MRFRFFKLILDAQSADETLSEEIKITELGSVNEISFYIVFSAGTSAGAVQIESAHLSGYSGVWAAEGSAISWSAASKASKVSISGASFVLRARISTAIVGGTVSVWAVANG